METRSGRGAVVVIGAGVAGLSAALLLRNSDDVVVVDKARGVGGRLATRRIGDATFDHGAQFVTAHTPDVARQMDAWAHQGIIRPWFRGSVDADGAAAGVGHPRFRGVAGMTDIAKHLARGLDVRLDTRVSSLRQFGDGWLIDVEGGEPLRARGIVATPPVPQTLELLEAGGVELPPDTEELLRRIRYAPCLALLAPLSGPSGLPGSGAVEPAGGPVAWMADNQTKGISATPAVTIHATAPFSETHWGSTDQAVAAALLGAAGLGSEPIHDRVQVQRWRYARPTVLHPDPCLAISGGAPLVVAGDAFVGPRVEGALLSGRASARALDLLLGDGTA